ncbi:MAG: TetR/AcrR family transcriptional regulator [Treponema sp.]|jgi:AcrR family transcriptional regulator|nr:TetR/AcrR family transcriptional regulator [Treponema sp.]
MGENAADRRIRKSKDRIKRALIALLLKKDLKDITVSELTELADINRGTFYLHYRDVVELFREIEEEMVEEFSRHIVKYKNYSAFLRTPVLGDIFQYVAMNGDICRALLRSRESTFISRIFELSRPGSAEEFQRYYKCWNRDYCDYYYDFICYGTFAMLRRWLETGMKENVEQVTLMVEKMISNCIENIT